VRCVCGEVVKVVNHVNLTLGHGREEGELTGAEGESGGAGSIELEEGARGG
jgi:ABC-type antimicrobial peptide transport system ATPase subunit